MKKRLKFIYCAFVAVICTALAFAACNHKTPSFGNEVPDSVYVAQLVENYINPSFTSINDVLIYRNNSVEMTQIDELFQSLPEETLRNVTGVCLKQKTSITKRDIVTEYRINKDIYDNLPPAKEEKIIREEQKTAENKVSVTYRTDTVDGKPVKTKITEEKLNED